uniref:ionotropic receptor 111 precursor n=1 Tax=Aedes aegypti TaxID=7159 RepID=UPI000C28A65D|nr:ionotropic receptor 111 precursor [Aedes aegypti]
MIPFIAVSTMIELLLLVASAHLSSSQPNNLLITIILQLKSAVCPQGSPLVLYRHENLDHSDAVLLNEILTNQSESKIITNELNQFMLLATEDSCGVFFFGNLIKDVLFIARLFPARKLIIAQKNSFHVIQEALQSKPLANSVIFVHDEQQYAIYHYNQFRKELRTLSEISADPIADSVRQFRLSVFNELPLEVPFVDLLLSRTNSSRVTYESNFHFFFMYEFGDVRLDHVYMHRTEGLRILVPRLNMPKPMIYVLIDPYDAATWVTYAAMVFLASILRSYFSNRLTTSELLSNIRLIFGFILIDSSITFYHELDRALLGLFKVMNIVLMTAYESLVISFLMSPRFYPEWDTIDQINESCIWDESMTVEPFRFRHIRKLPLENGDIYSSIEVGRNLSYCFVFSPRFNLLLRERKGQPLFTSGYRWSRATLQTSPVMAAAYGDPAVREVIVFYAAAFFAEAGLYQHFLSETRREVVEFTIQENPVGVGDLSLVWLVYLVGVGCSFLTFAIEFVVSVYGRKKLDVFFSRVICTTNELN